MRFGSFSFFSVGYDEGGSFHFFLEGRPAFGGGLSTSFRAHQDVFNVLFLPFLMAEYSLWNERFPFSIMTSISPPPPPWESRPERNRGVLRIRAISPRAFFSLMMK